MRTTLDLPDDLMKRAKIAAVERGSTLRDVVADGLRKTLMESKPPKSKHLKLPALKLPKGHQIPALTNRQIAELFDAEDIAHLNALHRGR